LPTPSWPRAECQRVLVWLALAACSLQAHAHGEADDPLPPEPGVVLQAAAAVRHLSSSATLPSARLAGYLLQGDAGPSLTGTQLEHGTLGLAARLDDTWGAQLVLGQHGSDPIHTEAAWLQARHDAEEAVWLLTAGRQQPALGAVLGGAGHLDRFGLVPLAARMAVNDRWVDDGLQLGWRSDSGTSRWQMDAGLWRGQVFPGSAQGGAVPSLHLGWAQGPWALDAVAARFKPQGRGSAVGGTAGHSHNAPVCDANLTQVVCFSGQSPVAAASLRWSGPDAAPAWPLTLTAAGWLRRDAGTLTSANGQADYHAHNRAGWLEAQWHLHPQWQLAWRGERLSAKQTLTGPGASLLAVETQIKAYAPITRHSLVLAHNPVPWAKVYLETGQETASSHRASFVALRLVLEGATKTLTPTLSRERERERE
jgi:hypothetical protein